MVGPSADVSDVHLYNPSADIREVLEITKLDTVLSIHEIEL